jgi:glycosyltransferase involved in cell wall biosynthesis
MTIRIATVYRTDYYGDFIPSNMAMIRWYKMSRELAVLGCEVDMIVNTAFGVHRVAANFRFIPYQYVDWGKYDVIKTLFHKGFQSLYDAGGSEHPFIISKLGSVVAKNDFCEGVFFYGKERKALYEIQQKIARHSRFITVLTEQSRRLWSAEHGRSESILHIPTGVDHQIPEPDDNPYRKIHDRIAVYIGHIYTESQRDVNIFWQKRLNRIGALLQERGIQLCFIGSGKTDFLKPEYIHCFDPVHTDEIWNYQYFADVGLALGQGAVQHNESSKIYYYLRTGLPIVSESSIPNNDLILKTKMGFICKFGDDQAMADGVNAAMQKSWPSHDAMRYMQENHSWLDRARRYIEVFSG